ncbi:MAG: competence/damage-inducible protein A [Kineosporiaceae bacterium]
MPNPTASFLVIGDEILSGRTREANVQVLAQALAGIGVDLVEVRVVRDDRTAIVDALDALRHRDDVVVTSGGIGPTHDDITADSVAAAFGVGIGVRDDARALLSDLAQRRGVEATEGLLRMARIPDGAVLIPNALSAAPGFTIGNVHVMAGVPAIFESMVAAVLPLLPHGTPMVSRSLTVGRGEAFFAGALAEVARAFADVSIGSYPRRRDGRFEVEIVVRGLAERRVGEALAAVARAVAEGGLP